MQQDVNALALRASKENSAREQLIREHEQLILRTAATVCRRYIGKSDDEWAVALCAFSRAVDVYEESKGDFLPFAQMLIRRDLIDAYRKQAQYAAEINVAPHILDGEGEPEEDTEHVYPAVVRDSVDAHDCSLHDEIVAANAMLSEYGFRFFDLTECSPRQEKTRQECAVAVRALLKDPPLLVSLLRQNRNNLLGDPSKARKELGWDPTKTSFKELVRLMVEHDMVKVAVERSEEHIKTNLAEYLEKGVVK